MREKSDTADDLACGPNQRLMTGVIESLYLDEEPRPCFPTPMRALFTRRMEMPASLLRRAACRDLRVCKGMPPAGPRASHVREAQLS